MASSRSSGIAKANRTISNEVPRVRHETSAKSVKKKAITESAARRKGVKQCEIGVAVGAQREQRGQMTSGSIERLAGDDEVVVRCVVDGGNHVLRSVVKKIPLSVYRPVGRLDSSPV